MGIFWRSIMGATKGNVRSLDFRAYIPKAYVGVGIRLEASDPMLCLAERSWFRVYILAQAWFWVSLKP